MSHNNTTVPEGYCGYTRWNWMESLISVLRHRANIGSYIYSHGWDRLPTGYKESHTDRDHRNYRTWYYRESSNSPMHPAIKQAVMLAPPADWHLLVLEYPHAADLDPSRIAYTRSDEHGYADRQTVTSVGKYLTRHFPALRDHQIRDIVMRHGAYKFEIWDDVSKIVYSVQEGPHSCMRWSGFDRDNHTHPYEAYAPEYGWRAAVRLNGDGVVTARCLVNVENMTFVRSYSRKDGEYSHSDEAIEVWLRDQGYTKTCDWEGLKLKRITTDRHHDDFWAPYLDGDCKYVADMGDHLVIDRDGEYECDRTDGHASGSSRCTCSDCGERCHEDDMHSIGYYGEEHVGPCCIDSYTFVLGRNGHEYYIPEDDAIYVESTGNYYDPEYLERYNIVALDDGDYVHRDEAVYLEYREIWVRHDDDCVVYCEHSGSHEHIDDCVQLADGEWALESDAWCCSISGNYYHNDGDDEFIELCDVETRMHHMAHEDAVEEYYEIDLDNVFDACEAMLEQNETV